MKTDEIALSGWQRFIAELITLIYIAVIAGIASATGAFYVMFPELGALSHDVFTRPRGTWARSPLMLAITPFLTAMIGIVFTRLLPYGFVSVLLTVGSAVALIMVIKSPIAPAISAGLLPLVLGVKSWWYPPGVLLGTVLLTALLILWERVSVAQNWLEPLTAADVVDETLEQNPATSYWLVALMLFVAMAVLVVKLTGLRFVLFPAGRDRIRDVRPYSYLPVGQATNVSAGHLFSHRCRWIALLESARIDRLPPDAVSPLEWRCCACSICTYRRRWR